MAGRGIYEGSPRTERIELETRTSDPATLLPGEAWLRVDLTDTDKVGELRWSPDGSAVNSVDISAVGTTDAPVEEVLRVQTPNGTGAIRTVPRSEAAYPEWSLQHNGSPLGLGYSAIPDSAIAHYDATQLSLTDGDSVSTWEDATTNGHDLTAGAAPTFRENILNGNPVVRWDGIDDYLDVAFSPISQPNTVFLVASTDPSSDGYIFDTENSNDRHVLQWFVFDGDEAWRIWSDGITLDGGSNDGSHYILTGIFDGSNSAIRVNGTQVASGSIGTDPLNGITLGASATNGGFQNGDTGEVVPCDGRLSISEIEAEEQRLSNKWGIAL